MPSYPPSLVPALGRDPYPSHMPEFEPQLPSSLELSQLCTHNSLVIGRKATPPQERDTSSPIQGQKARPPPRGEVAGTCHWVGALLALIPTHRPPGPCGFPAAQAVTLQPSTSSPDRQGSQLGPLHLFALQGYRATGGYLSVSAPRAQGAAGRPRGCPGRRRAGFPGVGSHSGGQRPE